ncbi:MAG: HAD hydrolase-like protein [Archangium sp.]|nr:HAD hydrolase-like protein [Archangium sp.]
MRPNQLWDLDGTLTDPRTGITRCFQHALRSAGLPVPPEDELLWIIGPPLQDSFAKLLPGASEAEVWRLVTTYRERYATVGIFENTLYADIPSLLRAVGHRRNFLATSKPRVFAEQVLAHFGLSGLLQGTYGSELSGERSDKGQLLAWLLEQERIDPRDAVMIGDRKHDVAGAKAVGALAVGVTWGYGSRAELEDAGADHVFDSPRELQAFLLGP